MARLPRKNPPSSAIEIKTKENPITKTAFKETRIAGLIEDDK
jgi:hypothetical protein